MQAVTIVVNSYVQLPCYVQKTQFGNHQRIFKTAMRYNDPIYDLKVSSAAFRIAQHAGGNEGAQEEMRGLLSSPLAHGLGSHCREDSHEIPSTVLDFVESDPTYQ